MDSSSVLPSSMSGSYRLHRAIYASQVYISPAPSLDIPDEITYAE